MGETPVSAFAPSQASARSQFVTAVGATFDRAGVEHVFLHGVEADARDSDVDVAVSRESLCVVDLTVRTGTFGRLLQRLDYDVPWYRYYVVATDDPDRRYRELDVACDPWGIGRYGTAARVALANKRRLDGLNVPQPAAEALYLAVKRARKGAEPGELERLRRAHRADPEGTRMLMRQEFGSAGERVAEALEDSSDIEDALTSLSTELDRSRRSPLRLIRRAEHQSRRTARRLARPTGLVIGLAGPDGVGKSTLAQGLQLNAIGAFRSVRLLHLRPALLPAPARLLGRRPAATDMPHGRPPSGRIASTARVGYLALDALLGWPARVAVPRIRSTLVVVERGLLDLTVDPHRYRLGRASPVLRRVVHLLPRPDLTLLLDAPAEVVHERKNELSAHEISRQLIAWRKYARLEPSRFRRLDASTGVGSTLAESLDVIDESLAARQGGFGLAALALECLGGPTTSGQPYSIVSAGGCPRWILRPGVGPHHAGLYRPASWRHKAALRALPMHGRVFSRAVMVHSDSGLAPLIADLLGVDRIELAAALPRQVQRQDRALISVLRDRKIIAFAKTSRNAPGLEREAAVLDILGRCHLKRIVVPEVLGWVELPGITALLLSPIATPGTTGRALGPSECNALVELAGLSDRLARIVGHDAERVPVHGDFSGWNSARLGSERLALWDWEEVKLGLPLEDFFHWKLARCVLMGSEDLDTIVREAIAPGPDLVKLMRDLGAEPEAAVQALVTCLERQLLEGTLAPFDERLEHALCQLTARAT
jgi:hypothetical protein